MDINFNTKEPRYIQIVRYFIYQIINGNFALGESLPSRRTLASKLGVNVKTVQKAFSELERQKIIVTEFGKRSYIQKEDLKINEIRTSLLNNLLDTFFDEIKPLNIDYDELITLIKKKYHDQSQ